MEEAETEWCSLEIGGKKQNVQSEKEWRCWENHPRRDFLGVEKPACGSCGFSLEKLIPDYWL